MERKYATKRTKWWTLLFPRGILDIDFDDKLNLFVSRERAEMEAREFSPTAIPVQIELKIKKPVKRKKPS